VGSRYYNPKVGRWINADSITDGGAALLGYNLFIYTANNPVNNLDLNGNLTLKGIAKGLFKKIAKPVMDTIKKELSKHSGTAAIGQNVGATLGPAGTATAEINIAPAKKGFPDDYYQGLTSSDGISTPGRSKRIF